MKGQKTQAVRVMERLGDVFKDCIDVFGIQNYVEFEGYDYCELYRLRSKTDNGLKVIMAKTISKEDYSYMDLDRLDVYMLLQSFTYHITSSAFRRVGLIGDTHRAMMVALSKNIKLMPKTRQDIVDLGEAIIKYTHGDDVDSCIKYIELMMVKYNDVRCFAYKDKVDSEKVMSLVDAGIYAHFENLGNYDDMTRIEKILAVNNFILVSSVCMDVCDRHVRRYVPLAISMLNVRDDESSVYNNIRSSRK